MNILVILSALLSVSFAGQPAGNLPEGVSALTCPNYPYCDPARPQVPALAGIAPQQAWAGLYGQNIYYGPIVQGVQPAQPAPASIPPGVSSAECPNYPFCGPTPPEALNYARGHASWAPAATVNPIIPTPATIPASVSAAECPNYPFCGPTPAAALNYRRTSYPPADTVPAGVQVSSTAVAPSVAPGTNVIPAPAKYPAGVNPASCPNYPLC